MDDTDNTIGEALAALTLYGHVAQIRNDDWALVMACCTQTDAAYAQSERESDQ